MSSNGCGLGLRISQWCSWFSALGWSDESKLNRSGWQVTRVETSLASWSAARVSDRATCGDRKRQLEPTWGTSQARDSPGARKIWLIMCGLLPGPARQNVSEGTRRTDGLMANFNSTERSNSASK